jgi:oligoendopeptidase F
MNEKQEALEIVRTQVIEFLKMKKGQRFSILQVYNELCKYHDFKIQYNSFINYVEMMASYGDIKLEDYGNVKLLVYEGKK